MAGARPRATSPILQTCSTWCYLKLIAICLAIGYILGRMLDGTVHLLGIAELDDDHLALGHIIAELEAAGERNAATAEVADIVTRLAEAAKTHFEKEEQMMQRHAYPFLHRHHQAHT